VSITDDRHDVNGRFSVDHHDDECVKVFIVGNWQYSGNR